jgi:phage terminase small subunit
MPARKPTSLTNRHSTKAERSARTDAESALMPKTELTTKPPAALTGHKTAAAVWKRLIGLYLETEGTIVTAFDSDLLIKYCLSEEELIELYGLRKSILKSLEIHLKWLNNLKPKNENLKDYFNALAQANALLQRFQGMDARMDGKRKLVFSLAQSMYLTPRSRAGVAPAEKEKPDPEDEMDQLLND